MSAYAQIHRTRRSPLLRKVSREDACCPPEVQPLPIPPLVLFEPKQPPPREDEQVEDVRQYISDMRKSIELVQNTYYHCNKAAII